jgi:uncharacterized protein YprB with RNaseH-like and TPR domain
MIIREYIDHIEIDKAIIEEYAMDNMAYFDIETTGFDKEKDSIILISLGFFCKDRGFSIKQYFAENLQEEELIIKTFCKDLSSFSRWCSFNGMTFDEPFIDRKLDKYNLKNIFQREHIDLYRIIRPYQKSLDMEKCNLKYIIENYLGITREDKLQGADCIEVYNNYLANRSEDLLNLILLHNYEDVLNLPTLFNVVNLIDKNDCIVRENNITKGQQKYLNQLIEKNNINIRLNINKISKKCAFRAIDEILKGNCNSANLVSIILSSY